MKMNRLGALALILVIGTLMACQAPKGDEGSVEVADTTAVEDDF